MYMQLSMYSAVVNVHGVVVIDDHGAAWHETH